MVSRSKIHFLFHFSYGIDTNPETGSFSFDVTCEITQDNQVTAQETMRIDVARKHDNGQLKGSLIGVIVGVVLAGILLIIAVALLVFAKATSRWCFADDEEPNTKPSGPVRGGRGGAGGGNPQAQVYRFILSFQLNLRYYTLCIFCLPIMLVELFILQHVADKNTQRVLALTISYI